MADEEEKTVELEVKIRSIPSIGRARVNTALLEELNIENEVALEIIPVKGAFQNRKVDVRVYADNMVEKGILRIGEEDCKKLGVSDGDIVYVRPCVSSVSQFVMQEQKLLSKVTDDIKLPFGKTEDTAEEK